MEAERGGEGGVGASWLKVLQSMHCFRVCFNSLPESINCSRDELSECHEL